MSVEDDSLGAAADLLNESFEQLEGALSSLSLGVSASVVLFADESKRVQRLMFKRTNAGWKLVIEQDDPRELVDLAYASRGTRVRAADKVEELYSVLIGERDRQLEQVLAATEKVDALTRKIIGGVR